MGKDRQTDTRRDWSNRQADTWRRDAQTQMDKAGDGHQDGRDMQMGEMGGHTESQTDAEMRATDGHTCFWERRVDTERWANGTDRWTRVCPQLWAPGSGRTGCGSWALEADAR